MKDVIAAFVMWASDTECWMATDDNGIEHADESMKDSRVIEAEGEKIYNEYVRQWIDAGAKGKDWDARIVATYGTFMAHNKSMAAWWEMRDKFMKFALELAAEVE